MCFVAHTVLVLNANIPVLNVTCQERGHLGREGLGSEVTRFMAERSYFCSVDIGTSSGNID